MANLEELLKHLYCEKQSDLKSMLIEFLVLFSDTPSCTHLINHDIDVGDAKPFCERFYRVSFDKHKKLESEVNYMLENNIAKPSFSGLHLACWWENQMALSIFAQIIDE